MMNRQKLSLHMLTAMPPHNVNRDEDGRPKTAVLGNVLRGRISSQAKKRALRYASHLPDGQRAIRTRLLAVETLVKLIDSGVDLESGCLIALAANKALGASKDAATEKGANSVAKKLTEKIGVIDARPLRPCIEGNEDLINDLRKIVGPEQAIVVSTHEKKKLEKECDRIIDAFRDGRGPKVIKECVNSWNKDGLLTSDAIDIDLALFGRMVAANAEKNIQAAATVGHAMTTHHFSVEADYFTAGEELGIEFKTTGAAYPGYGFYGSGIYYQHAVLDYDHLLENLAGKRTLARQGVEVFLHGLVHAQPKGKRNAFASDTAAIFVLARRTASPTVNLGFAFLDPVKGTDIAKESIERLRRFDVAMAEAYGTDGEVCVFNAYPPARDPSRNTPPAGEVWTYAELSAFAAKGVE
jgi:CRISPR system Cascade subunit CasC